MHSYRILIVEDEAIVAMDLQDRLEQLGHKVIDVVDTGEAAISSVSGHLPDLVLMDIRLKGTMDGIEAANQIKYKTNCPIIYLTAFSDDETLIRAKVSDPLGYLHKPCQTRDLRVSIELAVHKHNGEKRLRQDQQFYLTTLNGIGDGIIAVDAQGCITFINPIAEELTAWSAQEAKGRQVTEVFRLVTERTGRLLENLLEQAVKYKETIKVQDDVLLVRKDAKRIQISSSASPIHNSNKQLIGAVVAFRDISEQKKLEAQVLYTQKLESLGVLASAIAHDFNNLLMVIMGFSNLARLDLPLNSPVIEKILTIENTVQQAAALTKQMFIYAGKTRFEVKTINLSRLIEEVISLLMLSIPQNIKLKLKLRPDLPLIEADPTTIQQVLHHLLTNSSEAIGDSQGEITVSTTSCLVDEQYKKRHLINGRLSHGEHVCLSVSDTGCGISKENLTKIFDPFFTTKFIGRGLGLAAVHGIVQSHKGAIRVESRENVGTTFEILLPCLPSRESIEPSFSIHYLNSAAAEKKTVLILEEEETVSLLVEHLLSAYNHQVVIGNRDLTPIENFRKHPEVDVLLLDLSYPDSEKIEIVRFLSGSKVKIVIMSDYSEQEVKKTFNDENLTVLQKPFGATQLLKAFSIC